MKLAPAIWFSPTEDAVRSSGRTVLYVTSGFLLALILLLAWIQAASLQILLGFLVAVPAAVLLFRYPFVNLCVLLSLSVIVSGHEDGIQVSEVLFGLYYLAFLAHWFFIRLFVYRERILITSEDKALFVFLTLITLYIPLTFLFGGSAQQMVSEWTALVMIAFYFPVKEAFVRYRSGPTVLLMIFLWMGVYAAVAHMSLYQEALSSAEHAWQIVTGRVSMNDTLLMIVSLLAAVLFLHARTHRARAVLGGIFAAVFVGLVLTQSRAIWISFALGCVIVFAYVDSSRKKQMIWIGGTCVAVAGVLGLVFFAEYVNLVLFGLADRFASLSTAFTDDLSLINRFYESGAVLEKILVNPVVGYGMGVPYRFFDLTFDGTRVDAFTHNGYLSIWYKFGIAGFGLFMFFWIRLVRNGLRTFRASVDKTTASVAGLAVAVALVALLLSAVTANPFYLGDTTLAFGILAGIGAGAHVVVCRQRTITEGVDE